MHIAFIISKLSSEYNLYVYPRFPPGTFYVNSYIIFGLFESVVSVNCMSQLSLYILITLLNIVMYSAGIVFL